MYDQLIKVSNIILKIGSRLNQFFTRAKALYNNLINNYKIKEFYSNKKVRANYKKKFKQPLYFFHKIKQINYKIHPIIQSIFIINF